MVSKRSVKHPFQVKSLGNGVASVSSFFISWLFWFDSPVLAYQVIILCKYEPLRLIWLNGTESASRFVKFSFIIYTFKSYLKVPFVCFQILPLLTILHLSSFSAFLLFAQTIFHYFRSVLQCLSPLVTQEYLINHLVQ